MQIHAHLRRAIEAHARAARPGISAADLEAIVGKVAGSEQFAGSADFLDDSLIALVHADLPLVVKAFTLRHATAPPPTAPDARQDVPPDVWARMTPQEKLGRHYQAEAGERADIEAAALSARVGATETPGLRDALNVELQAASAGLENVKLEIAKFLAEQSPEVVQLRRA